MRFAPHASALALATAVSAAACSVLVDTGGLVASSVDGSDGGRSELLPDPRSPDVDVDACAPGDDSVDRCGPCGVSCPVRANGVPKCEMGLCAITCNLGFANCDDRADNGCEASLDRDPSNCGACGRDCGGGACNDARCEPVAIATGQNRPYGMTLDDANVYWVNEGAGTIVKCAKTGCGASAPTVIATNGRSAYFVAIDATTIFWNNNQGGKIYKCPLTGCAAPVTVASTPLPTRVVTSGDYVFWIGNGGDVRTAKKDGSGLRTVTTVTSAGGLVVANDVVYFASGTGIYSCPVAGCPSGATLLASNATEALAIAIDQTHVYWSTTNAVMRIARSGGSPAAVALGQGEPASLALSATRVYWANSAAPGSIVTAPKAGGPTEVIAGDQNAAAVVAVDGDFVYWTTFGDGTVMRRRL